LNKIEYDLSNKPKRLINRMFSNILAVLVLIRLFRKSNYMFLILVKVSKDSFINCPILP